jgi:hypothetical protein
MTMKPGHFGLPYHELAAIADSLLEQCEDEAICLASRLDALEPATRNDLLVSDLLNAYQVFVYFFRLDPGTYIMELLELQPASILSRGILLGEIDILELIFFVRSHGEDSLVGGVAVSDGEKVVAEFTGRNAYTDAFGFAKNNSS